MKTIHLLCAGLALLAATASARADNAQACRAAAGSFLTGVVVAPPRFAHGQFRKGVELSHTHLTLRADQDGRQYDVAIDNVFASGYQPRGHGGGVPAPLDAIRVNDRLELCGQLYTRGGPGIHWVHTNCGKQPQPNRPDGWIKHLAANGKAGDNLEGNMDNCSLFQSH